MTKYEVYNTTTTVQFLIEQDAIDYAAANSMQVRTIEEEPAPPAIQKTQREKYEFLKNLMLDFAGELEKTPSEAFAVKADVEELKFWAELGAAEAVIFKLDSIENNDIFTTEVKALLIGKIAVFINS
jgi:hypothetical protein